MWPVVEDGGDTDGGNRKFAAGRRSTAARFQARQNGKPVRSKRVAPAAVAEIMAAFSSPVTPLAAERDGGDLPACAVTVGATDKFAAEADRERGNADAAPARHQEMPHLVDKNDRCQHDQRRYYIAGRKVPERCDGILISRFSRCLRPPRIAA